MKVITTNNKWDPERRPKTDYKSYTSGLEGSSLLEVFTFEKELFSTSELVKCLAGQNLGPVNMAGYSPGSSLYISQCDAHCGAGREGGRE